MSKLGCYQVYRTQGSFRSFYISSSAQRKGYKEVELRLDHNKTEQEMAGLWTLWSQSYITTLR